jgi:predicted Zn-dependent protease
MSSNKSLNVHACEPKTRRNKFFFPGYLGIGFFDKDFGGLYSSLLSSIKETFGKFFIQISDLGYISPIHVFKKKANVKVSSKFHEKIDLYSTNLFYNLLLDKKWENYYDLALGITSLPIFSGGSNNLIFLYGEANLTDGVAVVSCHDLVTEKDKSDLNDGIIKDRIIKEALHELGHIILGPNHCTEDSCVMRKSYSLMDIDKKNKQFCLACEIALDQLNFHEI